MEISVLLKSAAASIVAIGSIAAGAYALDSRHAPISVVSDIGVIQIFNLVEIAQRDGSQAWICRAIDQELIKLCSAQKDHYLCLDHEAVKSLKDKAGC